MTVYILSYNSYFNRIVKKFDTLNEYNDYRIYVESQLNFNPGDGCDTTFVAGRQGNPYDGTGNYLIYSEDNQNITSRWFIIDQTRNLKNQYTLTLHRDVIVDSYNEIMNADVVIDSAIVDDANPLIYNAEPISVNEIKKNEIPLKDKTGCPWIVGYFDKTKDITVTQQNEISYDVAISQSFNDWYNANNLISNVLSQTLYIKFSKNIGMTERGQYEYRGLNGGTGRPSLYTIQTGGSNISNLYYHLKSSVNIPSADSINGKISTSNIYTNLMNQYGLPNDYNYSTVLNYNNKILKFKENDNVYSYKKINITANTASYTEYPSSSICNDVGITGLLSDNGFDYATSGWNDDVTYNYSKTTLTITYTDIPVGSYTSTISATDKLFTNDSPYGIFAIPYGTISINGNTTSKEVGMLWAMEAFRQMGGTSGTSFIYDLQLLPYCPVPEYVSSEGVLTIDNEKYYTTIKDESGNIVSNIIYPKTQTFTLNIPYEIAVDNKKMNIVCDKYRLCSPNYNGQFEFNAAKNGGVHFFNIDCTYKPYNPYIHINPDFNELYGSDYNDCRGLICAGDFSLPVMNDAWINYENNNKNYQNIFDRQIQNMDTNRNIQRKQEKVAIYSNALTGLTSGAIGGKMVSGGTTLGSAIGAGIGFGASVAAGYADLNFSDKLYNESKSFAKDNWELSLDNIKALPQSVGKTTAFTANNKIFPVIEYYSCTDEEKTFVANKIALNSMSVGVTDKPRKYINNKWSYLGIESKGFFRGKLLHADIEQDSRYLTTLAHELELGGYFTWA